MTTDWPNHRGVPGADRHGTEGSAAYHQSLFFSLTIFLIFEVMLPTGESTVIGQMPNATLLSLLKAVCDKRKIDPSRYAIRREKVSLFVSY
jgi:hypothetical protein